MIKNPIDEVWLDQPSRSKDPLEIHDLEFAGKNLKNIKCLKKYLFSKSDRF